MGLDELACMRSLSQHGFVDGRQRCAHVLCIPWPCVCVVMFREVPFTLTRVPPSVFSIHRLSATKRYVPADLYSDAEKPQHENAKTLGDRASSKALAARSWHHVSCRCEARRIRQWSFAALVTLMGGRVCVWLALLAVWLLYAPGTLMCLNVGFIRV